MVEEEYYMIEASAMWGLGNRWYEGGDGEKIRGNFEEKSRGCREWRARLGKFQEFRARSLYKIFQTS